MQNKLFRSILQWGFPVFSILAGLGIGEAVLRLKNSSMKNYDIEMWRYAKELKVRHPELGHVHVPSTSSVLQGVEIRTNEYGLRGASVPPPQPNQRRILFLGSSVTLGWGVPEDQTISSQIQEMFEADSNPVVVMNAGIGNYNSERYVKRFLTHLTQVEPTDIVVHYFLRDAEELEKGRGNWFLRNSQLAVTLWNAMNRYTQKTGQNSIVDHYRKVYQPNSDGIRRMKEALKELADYGHRKNIKLYLAMTPDIHNLENYQLGFIHQYMEGVARDLRYEFIDLLPALEGLKPQEVWSMPGDPHPNALGHKKMAQALYTVLNKAPLYLSSSSSVLQ